MNNFTTNETQDSKPPEVVLEIQLRTGTLARNEADKIQTQIDFTSYYLGSIFWFIRVAVEAQSLLEMQTETSAYTNAQFRENIQYLVQIGEGLAEWLPNYSPVSVKADKSEITDYDDLGEAVSAVLKSSLLPKELYNAFGEAINQLDNQNDNDCDAPELISRVIRTRMEKE